MLDVRRSVIECRVGWTRVRPFSSWVAERTARGGKASRAATGDWSTSRDGTKKKKEKKKKN